MLTKRCLNRRFLIQAVVITFLLGCVVMYYCPVVLKQLNFYKGSHKRELININNLNKQKFYRDNCFDGKLEDTLAKLPGNLLKWSKAYNRKCQILWKKFHTVYKVKTREGKLAFPSSFVKKVREWLGNNEKLMEEVYRQEVLQVNNHYSHEQTTFNLLRSKRPVSGSLQDEEGYIRDIDEQTKKTCDFCQYKKRTAEDVFGRIEGEHSASAANTFKLEKWHGLFLTKKHNPISLTEEEYLDLFNTSIKWFNKAYMTDPDSRYPMLVFDTLPKAGASQFHPHVHGILATQYLGHMKIQLDAAVNYDSAGEYWDDLIEIHHALGLTVMLGNAIAISPLTPVREHEIIIFSNSPGTDFFRLFYYVIQTYYKLKRMCFSSALAFPIIHPPDGSVSLPAILRIGTRGLCSSKTNDISSVDLYLMQNVNVDPYEVIQALQQTINKELKNTETKNMVKLE